MTEQTNTTENKRPTTEELKKMHEQVDAINQKAAKMELVEAIIDRKLAIMHAEAFSIVREQIGNEDLASIFSLVDAEDKEKTIAAVEARAIEIYNALVEQIKNNPDILKIVVDTAIGAAFSAAIRSEIQKYHKESLPVVMEILGKAGTGLAEILSKLKF